MSESRVLLDAAKFLDSEQSLGITSCATAEIREITQRFLTACYGDLGKAPRHLDDQDLAQILQQALPQHFGKADPLARQVPAVLTAYLEYLQENEVVTAAYEQRQGLEQNLPAFQNAVAEGPGAISGKGKTIVHRAEKTGRNDPCPCGSKKKFKKCCMGMG